MTRHRHNACDQYRHDILFSDFISKWDVSKFQFFLLHHEKCRDDWTTGASSSVLEPTFCKNQTASIGLERPMKEDTQSTETDFFFFPPKLLCVSRLSLSLSILLKVCFFFPPRNGFFLNINDYKTFFKGMSFWVNAVSSQ